MDSPTTPRQSQMAKAAKTSGGRWANSKLRRGPTSDQEAQGGARLNGGGIDSKPVASHPPALPKAKAEKETMQSMVNDSYKASIAPLATNANDESVTPKPSFLQTFHMQAAGNAIQDQGQSAVARSQSMTFGTTSLAGAQGPGEMMNDVYDTPIASWNDFPIGNIQKPANETLGSPFTTSSGMLGPRDHSNSTSSKEENDMLRQVIINAAKGIPISSSSSTGNLNYGTHHSGSLSFGNLNSSNLSCGNLSSGITSGINSGIGSGLKSKQAATTGRAPPGPGAGGLGFPHLPAASAAPSNSFPSAMQAPGLPRAAASAGDFSRFATPQQSALAARIHQKNPIPEHPWKPSPFKNNNPFLSQQQQRLTGQNTGFIAPSNSQTISPPNSFDGYFGNMTNVNAQRPESQTSRSEVSTGLPGSKSDGFLLRAMADQYGNHETQSQHSDASIQQQLSASNGSIQGSIHGSIQQDTLQLYQQEQAVPSHGPLNFDPVSEHVQRQRSAWLNQLTGANGRPSVQDILHPENVPFIETARLAEPTTNHGVICIGNIPYDVTRSEVIAFLGRSSRILNDKSEPIHIIMDRTTSKTNDCYVEFFTFDDAVKAVNRHQTAIENGRQPRLGKRGVDMTLSSQGKLMQQLFPAAHGVNWYTNPYTVTTDSAYGWENFKGFVSEEEMTMLYKHIETPTHSPFAMNCPERPYECMISTLKKFPWFMTELVTIKQRHYIYNAALKMIGFLKETIDRAANPARSNRDRDRAPNADRLTVQLFNRLIAAAMSCPGFTVNQKDNIAYLAYMDEGGMRSFNQPRMADSWRHQYALGVKPGAPLDVVEYYIALIREETNRTADKMSIVRKQKLKALQSQTSDYWGHFWCETNYPKGADFDNMSLADAGAIEWEALKKILRRAIEGGPIPNY